VLDTLFVMVEKNGVMNLMDRDTYDYQQGRTEGTDPAQRDLDELLAGVSRIRVRSGGMFQGAVVPSPVLLDTDAMETVATFWQCCTIVGGARAGHCACLGGPSLELFAGTDLVATFGVHHGHTIRWVKWKHDARLEDGERLTAWLINLGVDETLLRVLYANPLPFTGGRIVLCGPDARSPAEQRLLVAEIRYLTRDLHGALAGCDALIANHPEMGKAYALRGDIRECRGETEASVADYTRAIDNGYRCAELFVARAVGLDGLGQPDEAIDDLAQAIALDPNCAKAYNSRGFIHMKSGAWKAGLADLGKAIELAPEWEVPYQNRAGFAHMRSELTMAIEDYGRAIQIIEKRRLASDRPMLAKLYWNRYMARNEVGDKGGGRADRREAIRLDSTIGPSP
jgi:tetratricopeptide (TPR) repeat protein